jgi:hypothetical protein
MSIQIEKPPVLISEELEFELDTIEFDFETEEEEEEYIQNMLELVN